MRFSSKVVPDQTRGLPPAILDELSSRFIKGPLDPAKYRQLETLYGLPHFFSDLQGIKILIVDDKADNLELLQAAVEDLGIRWIRTAQSGLEALAVLKETSHKEFTDVDIVLLDIDMPRDTMDGIAVFEFLARQKLYPDTKIIFASQEDYLSSLINLKEVANGRTFDYYMKNHVLDSLIVKILHMYSLIYLKKNKLDPANLPPIPEDPEKKSLHQLMGQSLVPEEHLFEQIKGLLLEKKSTPEKLQVTETLIQEGHIHPERSLGIMRRLIQENLNEPNTRVKEALILGIGTLLESLRDSVERTTSQLTEVMQKEEHYGESSIDNIEKIRQSLFTMLARFPEKSYEQEYLRRLLFSNRVLTLNSKKFIVNTLVDYYRQNADEHISLTIKGIGKIFLESITVNETMEEELKCHMILKFAGVCNNPGGLKNTLNIFRERNKFNRDFLNSPFERSLGIALEILNSREA